MDTNMAIQNLDSLIASTRMTRQEHIGMSQSLDHLKIRASLLDAQEQKAEDLKQDKEEVSIKDAVNIGAEAARFTAKEKKRIKEEDTPCTH